MIAELLQLAHSNRLTGRESMRRRRIHWLIDLSADGVPVGFSPTVRAVRTRKDETREEPGKEMEAFANYHMQVKEGEVTGVNTNQNNWLPDFLCGEIDEVLSPPPSASAVARRNRQAWCELVAEAAAARPGDATLAAISSFAGRMCALDDLLAFVPSQQRDETRRFLVEKGHVIAFRVQGQLPASSVAVRQWWDRRVREQREKVITRSPDGRDAYHDPTGKLTESFPRFDGNVALASFDKAPFVSFGLRNQTSSLGIETAEKCAAALRFLLETPNTHLDLGEYTAVFWAIPAATGRECEVPFVAHLERADPLQVRDFLKSVWGSRPKPIDTSPFYAALLRIPAQGRFSVHSWLTETLGDAETNLRAYFNAITLGTDVDETPGIWRLAVATVPRTKRKAVVPAATAVALFHAALFGASVPHRAFGQAVARQRTELAGEDHADKEFRLRLAARTALLKLYFATNKGVHMTAENHEGENHPAYLCGRLLALLDKIHNEAHDNKSASSPAARYYGAASKTPALVFPQLCTLARYHLDKIGRGWAHNLEHGVSAEKRKDGVSEDFEGLAAVCARLKGAAGGSFPRILSLEEQGRFAIGFYFERVRKWPRSSDSPTTKEGKED